MRFLFTLPWALVLLCTAVPAEPLDTLITASDLLKISRPAAPAISPDGKKIVYSVRTPEARPSGEIRYRDRLWLAVTSGREAPRELPLAGSNARSPGWDPSGDRIVFVRPEGDGRSRIWVMPIAGGKPYAVSPPLRGTADPIWSPDGNHLLFTATVTYAEVQASLVKAKTVATTPPWPSEKPSSPTSTSAPSAIAPVAADPQKPVASASTPPPPPFPAPDGSPADRHAWLAHNETAGDPVVFHRPRPNTRSRTPDELEFTHLFVISRAGAKPVDLTPGFVSRSDAAWLPDSRTIVCSGPSRDTIHPDRINTKGLFILKADGSDHRPLPTPDGYSLDNPAVSPDGKRVVCTAQLVTTATDPDQGRSHVAVISIDEGTLKLITDTFDRSPGNPRWSSDGKFIYFTAETNGGAPLHRVSADGGNPQRITASDTWITGYDTSASDLALVIARAENPGELYRTRPNGRGLRILTAHNSNWLRDKKTVTPQRRKLKRSDGTQIEYWITRPPYVQNGFLYPLLVMTHEGPASMWGAGDPSIWHALQFFAARGYGVVFANPRGSSGYGAEFRRASFQNWASGPAGDVLAAADAVATREKWIDPDRQVILGDRYGGYLATWIISTDPRFKAAIASRGIYNLSTFLGGEDEWPSIVSQFGGHPWQPEIHKRLDAQSPFMRVESIHVPLLIKETAAENQSATGQGELLYRSLKALGRPVEFVQYRDIHPPDENADPAQQIDRLVRFDAFFQRFIGTPAQPVPPPAPPAAASPAAPPTPPAQPTGTPASKPAGGGRMMENLGG